MAFLLKRRSDTNENWVSVNPIIPDRQLIFVKDAGGAGIPLIKIGANGAAFNDLPYINKRNNLEATTSPTTSNNATQFYSVGSMWVNTSSKEMFVLTSFSGSDAVWRPIGELISELQQIQDVPPYPDDGYQYVLTELDGVLSWELPSGGGGGSQTLAQTLALGNETNGNDIVVTSGDVIDFTNAGIGESIILLPSGGFVQHVAGGVMKLQTNGIFFTNNSGQNVFATHNNGLVEIGSATVNALLRLHAGNTKYFDTIIPAITANRTITLPDGNIDWTAGSAEDAYVMIWDDALKKWSAGSITGGQVDSVQGTTDEIDVDDSDPTSPIVSLAQAAKDSLALADSAVQPAAISNFITESDLINTLRSFSKPQWLDVAVLTAASNVFTPDLGTAGSFTADIGANSTLANPTIPSGYASGKVLAWDITFTITGAGGWTLAFGNQYFVDADVDIAAIIADNNTTGDVIQLFFQFKNNVISVQPFIPTAI